MIAYSVQQHPSQENQGKYDIKLGFVFNFLNTTTMIEN